MEKFADDEACREHLRQARWGDGFECPMCSETEHWGYIKTRRLWECYECNYQCSITTATIMQDTKLPLRKWFLAAYLVFTTKKGITSHDLARKLGVKQETAWYLQQKLARVVKKRYGRELFGLVETDETYVGGKGDKPGRSTDKVLVMGLVEDKGDSAGNLHLRVLPGAARAVVEPVVLERVAWGTTIRTDGWSSYGRLQDHGYKHEPRIQVTRGDAAENLPWVHLVFSNFKRVMGGVHTKADRAKFQAYADLFSHRFNYRATLGRGLGITLAGLGSTPVVTRREVREEDTIDLPH